MSTAVTTICGETETFETEAKASAWKASHERTCGNCSRLHVGHRSQDKNGQIRYNTKKGKWYRPE